MKEKISLSIRVSIGVGAGAAVGLAWLIQPVNVMLFSNENGYHVLLVLGLSILFCSIALTAAAILQGLGNPYLTALFVGIGIVFKYLLNVLLIPVHSTMGAAVSTLVAFSSVAVMMVLALKKKTGTSIFERMPTVPLLVSIGMMSAVLAVYLLLTDALIGDSRTLATFQSIVGVVIGGLTYLLILIKNHFFTKEELMVLPLGKKLVKLLK